MYIYVCMYVFSQLVEYLSISVWIHKYLILQFIIQYYHYLFIYCLNCPNLGQQMPSCMLSYFFNSLHHQKFQTHVVSSVPVLQSTTSGSVGSFYYRILFTDQDLGTRYAHVTEVSLLLCPSADRDRKYTYIYQPTHTYIVISLYLFVYPSIYILKTVSF